MVKLQKIKKKRERAFKGANEIIYKETEIRLPIYFSTATVAAKRHWKNIFKMLRVNNCQLEIYTNFLENTQDWKHFQTNKNLESLLLRFLEGTVICIFFWKKENSLDRL